MQFSMTYHGDDNFTVQNLNGHFWCGEQDKWQTEEKILFSSVVEELFTFEELKEFIKIKFDVDLDALK